MAFSFTFPPSQKTESAIENSERILAFIANAKLLPFTDIETEHAEWQTTGNMVTRSFLLSTICSDTPVRTVGDLTLLLKFNSSCNNRSHNCNENCPSSLPLQNKTWEKLLMVMRWKCFENQMIDFSKYLICSFLLYRPLSLGGHVESQENKSFVFAR